MRGIANRQKKNVTPKQDYQRAKSESQRKERERRAQQNKRAKKQWHEPNQNDGGADAASSD